MLLSEGLHHLFLEFCQGAFQMFSTLFHNHQGLLLFCLCAVLEYSVGLAELRLLHNLHAARRLRVTLIVVEFRGAETIAY